MVSSIPRLLITIGNSSAQQEWYVSSILLVLFGGRYPPPKKKKIDAQNSHLWREIHFFQIIWLSIHQICVCVCFAVESNHPHRSISKKCTSMDFWASASDENAKLGKYLKVPKKYLMNWILLPKEICMLSYISLTRNVIWWFKDWFCEADFFKSPAVQPSIWPSSSVASHEAPGKILSPLGQGWGHHGLRNHQTEPNCQTTTTTSALYF